MFGNRRDGDFMNFPNHACLRILSLATLAMSICFGMSGTAAAQAGTAAAALNGTVRRRLGGGGPRRIDYPYEYQDRV